MATFQIPGDLIASVSALGGGAPPSGYYAAKVEKIEPHPSRATSRRMTLSFEGFSCTDWLNTPCDADGNAIPGLNEKQTRGMVAAIKSVMLSAGYTNDQMAQHGVNDDWLIGKDVFLEWHASKDLGAQYGKVDRYITKTRFDTLQAEGSKPAIVAEEASSSSASAIAPPAVAAAVPAPVATVAPAPVPAPSNGAPQTIGGATLPPPPVGAQGLTR